MNIHFFIVVKSHCSEPSNQQQNVSKMIWLLINFYKFMDSKYEKKFNSHWSVKIIIAITF